MSSIATLAGALGLCGGCQTGPLSMEEREARKNQELALKEAYLDRIQSVESTVYESLLALGDEVGDYNEEEIRGFPGAIFVTEEFYPYEISQAANRRGIERSPVVRHVIEGSPADEAGLLLGDRLVRINGKRAPRGEQGATFILGKLRKLWQVNETNSVVVERSGEEVVLEIAAENAVYYSVVVTPFLRDAVHAEGRAIYFSLNILEDLEEEEVDFLCAYALVQNVMKHARMKGKNELIGGVLDIAAMLHGVNTGGVFGNLGRNAYKTGFQVESDLLALYALARAGADIDGYPAFWEKRLTERSGEIGPADRERLESMRQVVREIAAKRAKGEPIYPTEYLSGEWAREVEDGFGPEEQPDELEANSDRA